ncbi:putative leader peptide [Pseudonocardia sp. CA-142604]
MSGHLLSSSERSSRKWPTSATLASVCWPLTRRRAVDLCRVGSCLCRTS